ncbi:restriction endonuclease [Sphingobacterium sp. SRCM116780]|uniref:nSTAND3 domain-containing NTPase n=1 Tax=Sphingobacterium sp. SRCM116780 TaxID=2907623 RepID=UPI001F477169|nr:restriction endonuclease [Sphingobacterium sp. SRCM116780]UIR57792.1 restriction endonuclease [Sphingobacterium sp. SRCM116780]
MYHLHSLGWYGFQQLCNSIIREVLGQTAHIFSPSNDEGKDGSFRGKWSPSENENYTGAFIIQCKFSSIPDSKCGTAVFKEEIQKVEKLVQKGECDLYIIMTNSKLSGQTEGKLKKAFKDKGVKEVLIFGTEWITQQITENARLRKLVPRVYGLGDLSQILDERVYEQGKAYLDTLKFELEKVVITGAYKKSVKAIEEQNFVLLIGEAATGKSTIASLLAMGALDHWKASTFMVGRAEKVVEHWNPHDPNQFFWIDDAFGKTRYEAPLCHEWNMWLPQISAMLMKGAKIVMTSRDYIYNLAKKDLKKNMFPLFNESQVVIDVKDLKLEEKKQMLYNHMKMGKQPIAYKSAIKPFLDSVSEMNMFIPETARRLSDPYFTKKLNLGSQSIVKFVSTQEGFLLDVIEGLDRNSIAALALIYINNDNLSSPLDLNEEDLHTIKQLGADEHGCKQALTAMDGSMVHKAYISDEVIWKYKHPTIGDAFAKYIVKDLELLKIFIIGSRVDKMLSQITCGDIKLKGATIVPRSLFPNIIQKLMNYKKSEDFKSESHANFYAKDRLLVFLSNRCSKQFLELYIRENPKIFDVINLAKHNYSYNPELDLAIKLFEYGLLPDINRQLVAQELLRTAFTGKKLDILGSGKGHQLLTEKEKTELEAGVKEVLIPNLTALLLEAKKEFKDGEDAEYHMSELKDKLWLLENYYEETMPEIGMLVQSQMEEIDAWIEDNKIEESDEKENSLYENESELKDGILGTKDVSIFEDVDL